MATDTYLSGTCDPRFEGVREAFAANFTQHGDVGAAVCVYVDGRSVLDLWGGYADAARTRRWEQDTIVNVASTTKGMVALCAHRLVERSLLDLDAPVARYWPAFAQAGKAHLPVRWLLSHRAGLRSRGRRGCFHISLRHCDLCRLHLIILFLSSGNSVNSSDHFLTGMEHGSLGKLLPSLPSLGIHVRPATSLQL